jgi:AraC-like DNA-binding protein
MHPATLVTDGIRYVETPVRGPDALCRWEVRAAFAGSIAVLPDGCVDWVFDEDERTVVGPATSSTRIELEAGDIIRGVRYRPGTCPVLFGRSGREMLDFVGPHTPAVARERDRLVDRAVALMTCAPLSSSIGWLAGELSVAPRTLRSRFGDQVGVSPKRFQQLVRVHRAVRLAQQSSYGWAAIAAESGFVDQAHLSRVIASVTGMTPSSLPIRTRRQAASSLHSSP